MSLFINFAELKEAMDITQVIPMLDLQLEESGKQLRGACSACGSNTALVITPSKQVFYCQSAKKGGDLINLVAHIRKCGVKEAAQFIIDSAVGVKGGDCPPENAPKRTFAPLTYLEYDHEAVVALGFDAKS